MKITLLSIGHTDQKYLLEGINIYKNRLKHYISFEIKEIAALKKTSSMTPDMIKIKEAEILMKHLAKSDCIVLLDEAGKQFNSRSFADFLHQRMNASTRDMIFVIGGALGFAESLYQKAHYKISLSPMTFSHQMVRLFFTEQLYRAFTIIKGESYHND